MANILYILCSSLVFLSLQVRCADNITDIQERDKELRIASTILQMGKRTKNPLLQLLGKSFDSLENKFDGVEKLVEAANIEKQMAETDRIENVINETERRLEQLITNKFEMLAEEICRTYKCTEWSEWTVCDSDNQVDYGLRNRTRECGKRASFCSDATEHETETESEMCQFPCPSDYNLTPSKYCVKLYKSITLPRDDAELQCQKDGGHLINIDSASKSEDVTDILNKENPGRVWFGGIQRSRYNREWEFSYGSVSLEYTNWDGYGQQRRYGYPNCMYLKPSRWSWVVYDCYYTYNFLCEISLK